MATNNSSDQDPHNFADDMKPEDIPEVSHSPLTTSDEKTFPSLDFSMISSGSSSFEVLSTSTVEGASLSFDEGKPQLLDRGGTEEKAEKLKDNQCISDDERDQQPGKSLSSDGNPVEKSEDKELSHRKENSFDDSMVLLGKSDIHDSLLSEQISKTDDCPQQSINSKGNDDKRLDQSRNKTTADEIGMKDKSLGESLVVLAYADFENSSLPETSHQPITDRMIAGLMNSTTKVTPGEDGHQQNIEEMVPKKTNMGESDVIKNDLVKKHCSDDEKSTDEMKLSTISVADTEMKDKETLDTAQSSWHQNRGDVREDTEDNLYKNDLKETEPNIPPVSKTENSFSGDTGTIFPEISNINKGTDSLVSLKGSPGDSLVILEQSHKHTDTDETNTTDVSKFDNGRNKTSVSMQEIQTSELTDKGGNLDEKSKDGSLSESLVVIEKDEVENNLDEGTPPGDQQIPGQEDASKEKPKEMSNLVVEGKLNTNDDGMSESTNQMSNKSAPLIGLTHKVVESIVGSLPSYHVQNMDEQPAGGYQQQENQALDKCQLNNSLEGSCISTESFAILSESVSDKYLDSEEELNQLQSNFTFPSVDLSGIEQAFGGEKNAKKLKLKAFSPQETDETAENETDQLEPDQEYIAGTVVDIEGHKIDLYASIKKIEAENEPELDASSIDDASLVGSIEVDTQFGNLNPNSSQTEGSDADRKLFGTSEPDCFSREIHVESHGESQYPSLSSGSSISMRSFVIIDDNGRSGSMKSLQVDEYSSGGDQPYEYLSGKLDTDKVGRSTLDGEMMENRDQINVHGSETECDRKESPRLGDSQIHSSLGLQEYGDRQVSVALDEQEENDVIASLPSVPLDEPVASSINRTEFQPLIQFDEDCLENESLKPLKEISFKDGKKVDENLSRNQPQSDFDNRPFCIEEEEKHQTGSTYHVQDPAEGTESTKTCVDENTWVYKQQDTTSAEGQTETAQEKSLSGHLDDLKANTLHKQKDEEGLDQEHTKHFQDTAPSELETEENLTQHDLEACNINRNSKDEGPVKSDRTPSMDTNDERFQQTQRSRMEHVEQVFSHEEEDDDSTLTLDPTEKTAQVQLQRDHDGTASENSGPAIEWYNESVTIYVLRQWNEYEDGKPKVRKDQHAIVKEWIKVEKVRFLFNSFRLSSVLKAKLPPDTEVIFDDLKTNMSISNCGQPFRSDEEYRSWWEETIRAVFETVGEVSAYLCNLDNITKESTIESTKRLTYANVKVTPTKIPETYLVLGTANIGSTLYNIQSQNDHNCLLNTDLMRDVKVIQMPHQWTKWCRHITGADHGLEKAGILDIHANEDDGHTYVVVDIHHKSDSVKDQWYVEHALEMSSEQALISLCKGEYELLSHGEVKNYINNHKLSNITCHWMVKKSTIAPELLVLADSQDVTEKVAALIKSSIKVLDLKATRTEQHKRLQIMKTQFRGKLCWSVDDTVQMTYVYVTDDILPQVSETIEVLGGRKLSSAKVTNVTSSVHIEGYDQIRFFNKYVKDDMLQMRNSLKVDMSFQDISPDRVVIQINGPADRVNTAQANIQTSLNDITSFQHPNVELSIPQIHIEKVRDLEMVNRCVIATHSTDSDQPEDDQLTFDNFSDKKTVIPTERWTCGQAQLGFVTSPVNNIAASVTVNMLPIHSPLAEAAQQATIFVPHPGMGKAKHDLAASITRVFKRLEGVNSVAVDLHNCCDWSFSKFLKVALQAMKELCSLDTSLRDIILAVPMEDYQSACSITESSGLQRSRGRNPIQVLVLKGDITKEQADVIVNTTSKCLDLSSGTVSNALSQRAGPKLQKECRKKYANGIKFGELAVTDGHQLLCRKVFHGAFDVWPSLDKKNQTKKTEMVGKFVTKCLERANELGMNSISFPAIGTGNLNYPSSVVAKEMLQKIKCFMVESNPSHLKKISIVVYPRDTQTFANFTEEEKSIMVGESSVDPWPKTQPVNIREQTTPQHRVYFRVTCSAADKMILVSKIDNILRDDVRKPDHDKVDNGTGDLEPVQKTRPETRRSGRGEISLQDEQEDIVEAMDMTLKASRSDSGVTHYIKPTSVMESCVVIQSQHTRTDVRNWLERDLGVRPFGIAWPYRNKVNEVLVTCKSKTDAEKVLREKNADFQTATMEQQGLFNVHAFMDPKFLPYKCKIQENSGATVEVDMSGMCQLVGNFPQIEAANEYINSMDMRQKEGSVKINLPSEEGYVDGINVDVYNAFSVFLQKNPSYKHYQKGLKSMRYSEVDTTLYFFGSKEFCLDFKKKLTQMKCDTVCVQIDVEGRHFKMGSVKEILRTLSDSQYDVYISIPQEETMKVINLIGLDRNKVQTMKYKVLESIGMANSRRTRNFDCGFSSFRTKEPILVLPPPPSARLYHLGDNMEVLVYSGDILGLKVDGIVNAANEHLDHGGGVANAISDAANIQRESTEYVRKNGKVKVGTSCHTSAGNLKHYKYIIHAVGPHWDSKKQSECEQKLQDAVMSSILEADVLELESVAIPAISAGIFSMPPALCVVQYRLGLKRAWSKLKQKTQHFVKEVHFVDKNAVIVQEIENEFDSLLESANLNPQQLTGHQPNLPTRQISGRNVPSTPFIDEGNDDFTTKGAIPKAKPLYPYREFSNRRGIDEETFHLTSETRVHVYTCDILATRVDAIVCGQDKQLHSNSRIATRIKEGELSGVKFSMEMSKIKKNYKKKYGEMFHVPITGFDAGILLMVICPSLSTDSLSKCKKEIHSCALNVFTKATELRLRSIALPVLGTGSDINKARNIAKVIMESILKFAQTSQPTNSLKDIHFVNHDPNVTKAIVEMFEGHVKAGEACIQTSFKPKVFPGSAKRLVQSLHQLKQDCLDDYHRSAWKSDDHHQFERTPSFVHQNEQQTHLFKMTDDKSQSDADIIKEKPRIYEDCVICMDTVTSDNVKTLPKCNHSFHPECIDAQFTHKPVCPTCGAIYGVIIGNQPRNGKMNTEVRKGSLPGFEGDKQFIYILYSFPDGIQENDHPNPGVRYKGTSRGAYLPDNPKGRAVLEMLKIAFKRRLTFTIGHSRTTGEENVVTWNDIHHKTNKTGGQQQYGYPDPEYLERVSEELAVKGVTEADIQKEQ